jgi:hypothetical protein
MKAVLHACNMRAQQMRACCVLGWAADGAAHPGDPLPSARRSQQHCTCLCWVSLAMVQPRQVLQSVLIGVLPSCWSVGRVCMSGSKK